MGLSPQIWWLSVVIFVNRCGTMVIPFLTVYLTHKGYSLAQAGFVMAAFGTGGIVGGYLGGRMTDKIGFHQVQFLSLLLNGIMFFVLGQMQTLPQIIVCIFVLASLGEAFRPANAAAVVAYSNDSNRTRCYSLNRLAINLGWSIGPAVGGILASINYSLLFWVDGVTCILASLLLYTFMPPSKQPAPKKASTEVEPVNSAYRDKIFLKGMFYIFLIGICFFQLFTILPVYYKEMVHMNEAAIGWTLAINGVIIVLVEMVLVYKLENRRNAMAYIVTGAILMGLSFITLNIAQNFPVVLTSMLFVTFGEMLVFPFINNFWVGRSNERNRGQYAAVFAMSFATASVIGPTLAAQIATRAGFPVLWAIDCGICIIAATGYFLLKKKMYE